MATTSNSDSSSNDSVEGINSVTKCSSDNDLLIKNHSSRKKKNDITKNAGSDPRHEI